MIASLPFTGSTMPQTRSDQDGFGGWIETSTSRISKAL